MQQESQNNSDSQICRSRDRVGYTSLRFGNSSEALRMWSVFEKL